METIKVRSHWLQNDTRAVKTVVKGVSGSLWTTGFSSLLPRLQMNEICQVHARLLFVLSIVLLVKRSVEVFCSCLKGGNVKRVSQDFD